MGFWNLIVRFFQGGGDFMYPIAIVFVVGLAIAIERYIYLTAASARNRSLWNQIVPMLSQGNFRGVVQVTSKSDSAIAQILNYGLARIQSARRRDDIEKAMEESLMEVVPRLEKRTHYLATFANLATLLGLLGTVMGLISAFQAVATVNPAEKANLLSASISVAMNCTAFGLMTAVPLLFIHAFLQTKTTELIDSLEMASVKFLNAVTERQTAARGGLSSCLRVGPQGLRVAHAPLISIPQAGAPQPPAGRAAARADDRHLHRAGDVPADDRGVLPHRDPAAEPARRPDRVPRSAPGLAAGGDGAQGPAEGGRPQHRAAGDAPGRGAGYDYDGLTEYLKQVKAKFPEKTDATVLLETDTPYDTLVQVMDRVRVFEAGAGIETVQAELFPDISIGDAPATDAAVPVSNTAPAVPVKGVNQ